MPTRTSAAIQHLQTFVFDLDGVIWRGQTAIEGAVESIAWLKQAGKRCFYCTNNSGLSQDDFVEKLARIGIQTQAQEVITSASATALYLQREMPRGFSAYVIGGQGIIGALQSLGVQVSTGADEPARTDCVVVGIDRQFSYDKLRVSQKLIHQGARFIATNRDATFPVEGGVTPGAGSLVAAVETASGTLPVTIGKPEPLMLQLCLETFGLQAHETAMIGDRLDTDIACAHRAGIMGILVETGVSKRADGEAAQGDEKPDAIFADLPALCRSLKDEG